MALFRVINRYVGNLAPMRGVFPDYPAPVIRNSEGGREMAMMRWGMPLPPRTGGPPVTDLVLDAFCLLRLANQVIDIEANNRARRFERLKAGSRSFHPDRINAVV